MVLARERQYFPTRNYPYRYPSAYAAADGVPQPVLAPGRVHAFVVGLDQAPRPMPDGDVEEALRDPFAELLLKRGTFPLTSRALLAALDAVNGDPSGLPEQDSFLVADGGQIRWTQETADVERLFRFAIVRSRAGEAQLMISGSSALNSDSQFIQVLAWDPAHSVYNYYERRAGTWIWCGNSYHALEPRTRGKGPFDSHVNGSLVMKELRAPWNNWHSMDASITDAVLAPGDPLRNESIFVNRVSAHVLERSVVRPGIERWNKARLARASEANGTLRDVPYFLRQVLETTTVNLASSGKQSAEIKDDSSVTLPTTFFLNAEALLDEIGLEPDIAAVTVLGRLYRESLTRYAFALTDGKYRQPGDAFFAFLVPEPAFEDLNVLSVLLRERIVSRRFAACLLMIDFANPILSPRRKHLMRHAPLTCCLGSAQGGLLRSDLEVTFVAAVENATSSAAPDSPEAEFLANWRLPDGEWQREFARRIEAYFAALKGRSATEAGFDGWVRLAESRRREFRRRPLAEFRLTVPTTNIPDDAPALEMCADGSVRVAPSGAGG